jgi:hypothetical protein
MTLPALAISGATAISRLEAGKVAIVFAQVGPFRLVGFVYPDGTVDGATLHLGPTLWPIRFDGSLGRPWIGAEAALPPGPEQVFDRS